MRGPSAQVLMGLIEPHGNPFSFPVKQLPYTITPLSSLIYCRIKEYWTNIMALNVEHLMRTSATLEQALLALKNTDPTDEIMFDLYRNAAIKSFELSLETSGKLLRKALKAYGGAPRSVDSLVFNDVLRHAGKHAIFDEAAVTRWLAYRANRNNTAHDYGEGFANDTLKLLPAYLQDVRALATKLQEVFDAAS